MTTPWKPNYESGKALELKHGTLTRQDLLRIKALAEAEYYVGVVAHVPALVDEILRLRFSGNNRRPTKRPISTDQYAARGSVQEGT